MATQRSSFAKLQRDRDKKMKAAAKRERRLERKSADAEPTSEELLAGEELSPEELLKLVEALHQEFEAKAIDFETFEERKADLMSRLSVD